MYPIVKGIACGAATTVALLATNFILPAWAVSFEVGGQTFDLGALAPWIGIIVTIVIWRDARQARIAAAEAAEKIKVVSTQIDGLLADRDKAKIIEGEVIGTKKGEEAAEQLAEGQRQGVEMARSRAADKSSPPSSSNNPLPVADDRTNLETESIAESMKRSADAGESLADTAKKA